MGEIVKKSNGRRVNRTGVSSRGMGSLDQKNGVNYVRNDFIWLTGVIDIVVDPSFKPFVEGIMEGKEDLEQRFD